MVNPNRMTNSSFYEVYRNIAEYAQYSRICVKPANYLPWVGRVPQVALETEPCSKPLLYEDECSIPIRGRFLLLNK